MAKLSLESVQFARNHITSYWDSDFFPKPFEFDAIWRNWNEALEYLTTQDVSAMPVASPRTMLSLKPDGTYRVVHQLEPLDAIVYTALAYTIAAMLESVRVPVAQRVACSYRISLDDSGGNFFTEGNGYPGFLEQSRFLADQFKFVLVTDVTDFYNQIYVHRLQNAVQKAHKNLEAVSKEIEEFLMRLNSRVSRGIPVGPAGSIIFAEAVLTDIDSFILARGHGYTRYVDDIRIFANSNSDLDATLRDLTLYIYNSHRLTLSSHKTEVLGRSEFVAKYLEDPEQVEKQQIHDALSDVEISDYDGASEETVEEDPVEIPIETRIQVLQSLMDRICQMDRLDLGLARHVLRTCRRYRIRAIVTQLFNRFDFFLPVISDVVLYLNSVTNATFVHRNASKIWRQCLQGRSADIPFARMWLCNYIVNNPAYLADHRFARFVRESNDIQAMATWANKTGDVALARELCHRFNDVSLHDRRQILRASVVLAREERRPWYNNLRQNPQEPLDRWVLNWVASQ
jgi:hypothetical protein